MTDSIGISDVKAKFSAICDRAAHGEVIRFTRRRGSHVEYFELRRSPTKTRELGVWRDKFTPEQIDELSAPTTDDELIDWNI